VTAQPPGVLSRRSLVKGVIAALSGLGFGRLAIGQEAKPPGPATDAEEIAKVEKLARDAGLGPLRNKRSPHFLAVGDAPERYLRWVLDIMEPLGRAILVHFRGHDFELEYPDQRLTLIALRDRESYAALEGGAPAKDVYGHYDRETNRLVIFDVRPQKELATEDAARVDLFSLVHETAHLLSFNTGILNRQAVVPLCVCEGLATYVELWGPRVKNGIGGVNGPRMEAMQQAVDWIPIGDLLADDDAFEPKTVQLAYAESWLLVHYLLHEKAQQQRFRQYLAELPRLNKPDDRTKIAEETLGPLEKLDHELKDEARRYLRG